MKFTYAILLVSFLFSLNSVATFSVPGETYGEFMVRLSEERKEFTSYDMTHWANLGVLETPVAERFTPLNQDMAHLVRNYLDVYFSYRSETREELPLPANIPEEYKREIREAVESFPLPVKDALKPHLTGISLVQGIKTNGFASVVMDSTATFQRGGFFVLNTDKVNMGANAWLTKKESSPFKGNENGEYILKVVLAEGSEGQSRKLALQFILLHEMAHIIAFGKNIMPRWEIPYSQFEPGAYPYFDFSWERFGFSQQMNESISPEMKSLAKKLVYFQGESARKLNNSDMPSVYQALAETSFIAPYAAKHPHEDFADLFAYYVLTKHLGKRPKFEIRDRRGRLIHLHNIAELIDSPKFAEKVEFIESLLLGSIARK